MRLLEFTDPRAVSPTLLDALVDCWIEVTNAGGAAGFPFPPVDAGTVAPVARALTDGLHPERARLVAAFGEGELLGWVTVARDLSPVIAHWGVVRHLQTRPAHRGHGIGAALMRRCREIARDEMALEQLRLAVRGGMGLEDFYAPLGWREIGRWPNALRLAHDDTRDEVLMVLAPL